jgi:hypothetical protein
MNNGHDLAADNPLVGVEPDDELVRDSRLVLVVAPDLPAGMAANHCAVLATGIAARHPEIIGHDQVTVDGAQFWGFTMVPIAVLVARDRESLKTLAEQARATGCSTLVYLSRAQGVRLYAAYLASVATTTAADLDIDTVGLFGPRKAVASLTGNLPALR